MNSIYKSTQSSRQVLAKIVGETRVKTFFSYYAIFTRGLLFGLYKDDKLYIRLPENVSQDELPHKLERLSDFESGIGDKHFYHISPEFLVEEMTKYTVLIDTALHEIARKKLLENIRRKKLIRSMPNLNINIERLLKKLGINSIAEFIEKGPFKVYAEMIKIGIDASPELLYKLYGAVNKQIIYTMSHDLKIEILKEADRALYDAGLRKRFNID